MRAWRLLLNTVSILALVVINVHLAYGSYDVCSVTEQCTKVQECRERLIVISQDEPQEIADLVQRKLCKFTTEGIHVCCPLWNPKDQKDCDKFLDKKYNDKPVYPWQAKLLYKSQKNDSVVEFKCDGALISKAHILTAAHCLVENDWVLTEVWLAGDIKMPGSQIPVEKIIKHELFNEDERLEYDIGLVQLRFPVNTGLISPVCLSRPLLGDLKKENFTVIDNNGNMQHSQFVAAERTLLKMKRSHLIRGDSGRALFHVYKPPLESRPMYYLVGVFAGWHQTNGNDYFVNIDQFHPWLKSRVNNNSN